MSQHKPNKDEKQMKIRDDQDKLAREQMQETNQDILALKNAGLLRKLFPDNQYREYVSYQLGLIKTELEARQLILSCMREAQIKVIQKTYEAWAAEEMVGIDACKQLKIMDLIKTHKIDLSRLTEEFNISYMARYEKAEKIKNEKVRSLEQERLDSELISFYKTMDVFAKQFSDSAEFHNQGKLSFNN